MRDFHYLNSESGMGYALGIVGGVMMLLLLLYPLRKRYHSLKILGGVKHWFRIHMILGVLGPSFILYHSNFSLGALNSNVALFSMSIVAASGLMGRYFYSRIHYGLYGRKASLQELKESYHWKFDNLVDDMPHVTHLQNQLKYSEEKAFRMGRGVFAFITIPWFTLSSRYTCLKLWSECKSMICASVENGQLREQQLHNTRRNLKDYFVTLRQAAGFSLYERLFSAWHILHMPLFVMMLITGIIHVVAVHMY